MRSRKNNVSWRMPRFFCVGASSIEREWIYSSGKKKARTVYRALHPELPRGTEIVVFREQWGLREGQLFWVKWKCGLVHMRFRLIEVEHIYPAPASWYEVQEFVDTQPTLDEIPF